MNVYNSYHKCVLLNNNNFNFLCAAFHPFLNLCDIELIVILFCSCCDLLKNIMEREREKKFALNSSSFRFAVACQHFSTSHLKIHYLTLEFIYSHCSLSLRLCYELPFNRFGECLKTTMLETKVFNENLLFKIREISSP